MKNIMCKTLLDHEEAQPLIVSTPLERSMIIRVLLACLLLSAVVSTPVFALTKPELNKLYETAKTGDGQALNRLRIEATAGNNAAQLMLGNMYAKGVGVSKDYKETQFWYTKAADAGLSDAQYNLGQMYRKGLGVPQDDKKAVGWYRKASDQGNTGALYNLGGMYLEGRGVPKSATEAKKLWEKAAVLGHQGAKRALSQFP